MANNQYFLFSTLKRNYTCYYKTYNQSRLAISEIFRFRQKEYVICDFYFFNYIESTFIYPYFDLCNYMLIVATFRRIRSWFHNKCPNLYSKTYEIIVNNEGWRKHVKNQWTKISIHQLSFYFSHAIFLLNLSFQIHR